MLKLWNWRKKRKKEKINKKIITFFVRNFLHSSVPKISALCILYFFIYFLFVFWRERAQEKKRKDFFFFLLFYYLRLEKLKFLIFDTNPISGGKVKTGRVGVFIERKRFFVLRVHTWNIIRKK